MLIKSPQRKSQSSEFGRRKVVPASTKTVDAYFSKSTNGNATSTSGTSKKLKGKIKPAKIILWSFIVGLFGFLYITHVFTTQKTLQQVSDIRLEHERLRIIYEDKALTYEQLIGPAQIYERAKSLGFIDSSPHDKVLEVRRR
jgi:hypothetical protein